MGDSFWSFPMYNFFKSLLSTSAALVRCPPCCLVGLMTVHLTGNVYC